MMIVKLFTALLAAAAVASASDPLGRATWTGSSGRSAVQVGPGGYGFVGEIGPGGVVGRTTDGRHVGPAAGPAFAAGPLPADPFGPDVRFTAGGGVEVNVPGVHVSAGGYGPVAAVPSPSEVAAAVRAGRLAEAASMAADLRRAFPLSVDAHLAESVVHLRAGRLEEAGRSARAALRLDPRPRWASVRAYYPDEEAYHADVAAFREGRDAASLWLRTLHAGLCDRADVRREALERLSDLDPTDRLAARLLSSLPPRF